jgi:DNA-directed RNA polymerase subunit beta'
MMGAEAIKELLKRVGRGLRSPTELREKMRHETSPAEAAEVRKAPESWSEAFRKSGNKPQWMILDVIPGHSAGACVR